MCLVSFSTICYPLVDSFIVKTIFVDDASSASAADEDDNNDDCWYIHIFKPFLACRCFRKEKLIGFYLLRISHERGKEARKRGFGNKHFCSIFLMAKERN